MSEAGFVPDRPKSGCTERARPLADAVVARFVKLTDEHEMFTM